MPARWAASAHCSLRCSVGATTVTRSMTPPLEELGCEPEREGRLAGARGGGHEEVARRAFGTVEVGGERLLLPGAELVGGAPGARSGKARREMFGGCGGAEAPAPPMHRSLDETLPVGDTDVRSLVVPVPVPARAGSRAAARPGGGAPPELRRHGIHGRTRSSRHASSSSQRPSAATAPISCSPRTPMSRTGRPAWVGRVVEGARPPRRCGGRGRWARPACASA